jgi:tRNA(Ile2) C34 agmatinyltransferase TiaS
MALAATPTCRNCGKTMRSIAEIAPANDGLGMRAFRCERCGISASVLSQPTTRQLDHFGWKDKAI